LKDEEQSASPHGIPVAHGVVVGVVVAVLELFVVPSLLARAAAALLFEVAAALVVIAAALLFEVAVALSLLAHVSRCSRCSSLNLSCLSFSSSCSCCCCKRSSRCNSSNRKLCSCATTAFQASLSSAILF